MAVEDYLDSGYLPEALINFVALLGFNPSGDQIYTVDELTAAFDLEKINKSGAVFNREKLDWMNGQYIRILSPEELMNRAVPFLVREGKEVRRDLLLRICTVERERLIRLCDIVERVDGYLTLTAFESGLLVWKTCTPDETLEQIERLDSFIETRSPDVFSEIALIEKALRDI